MLVSGLWHGLSWHMMAWDGLHGLYLVVERLLWLKGPITPPKMWPLWRQGMGMITVFVLVSICYGASHRTAVLGGMLDWSNPLLRYRRQFLFIPLLALTLGFDWLQRRYQDEEFFLCWPRLAQASLLAVSLFLLILLMQSDQQAPFVYQGF